MSIFSRFFGDKDRKRESEELVRDSEAGSAESESPLSLQILFSDPCSFDVPELEKALRAFHKSMAQGSWKLEGELSDAERHVSLASWGKHGRIQCAYACRSRRGLHRTCPLSTGP